MCHPSRYLTSPLYKREPLPLYTQHRPSLSFYHTITPQPFPFRTQFPTHPRQRESSSPKERHNSLDRPHRPQAPPSHTTHTPTTGHTQPPGYHTIPIPCIDVSPSPRNKVLRTEAVLVWPVSCSDPSSPARNKRCLMSEGRGEGVQLFSALFIYIHNPPSKII